MITINHRQYAKDSIQDTFSVHYSLDHVSYNIMQHQVQTYTSGSSVLPNVIHNKKTYKGFGISCKSVKIKSHKAKKFSVHTITDNLFNLFCTGKVTKGRGTDNSNKGNKCYRKPQFSFSKRLWLIYHKFSVQFLYMQNFLDTDLEQSEVVIM